MSDKTETTEAIEAPAGKTASKAAAKPRKAKRMTAAQIMANLAKRRVGGVYLIEPDPAMFYKFLDLANTGGVAAARKRLKDGGFTKMTPTPEVHGITLPEVWEIDADLYEATHMRVRTDRDNANRARLSRKVRRLNA